MTVYVDNMGAKFGRLIMCHMIADTDAELRSMADMIGIAQRWHQGDHFDVCLAMRAKAIAAGAIEVTQRQLGAMVIHRRGTGQLGMPEEAEQWLRERFKQCKNRALE